LQEKEGFFCQKTLGGGRDLFEEWEESSFLAKHGRGDEELGLGLFEK
jgi:hypothetical protein